MGNNCTIVVSLYHLKPDPSLWLSEMEYVNFTNFAQGMTWYESVLDSKAPKTKYRSPSLIKTPLLPNNSVLFKQVSFGEREHHMYSCHLLPRNCILSRECPLRERPLHTVRCGLNPTWESSVLTHSANRLQ